MLIESVKQLLRHSKEVIARPFRPEPAPLAPKSYEQLVEEVYAWRRRACPPSETPPQLYAAGFEMPGEGWEIL